MSKLDDIAREALPTEVQDFLRGHPDDINASVNTQRICSRYLTNGELPDGLSLPFELNIGEDDIFKFNGKHYIIKRGVINIRTMVNGIVADPPHSAVLASEIEDVGEVQLDQQYLTQYRRQQGIEGEMMKE